MASDSAVSIVTVTVAATRVQEVLSALTMVLLHGQHAFLQTFYDAQHTAFEIDVPPHVSGIRLHVRATADEGSSRFSASPVGQAQPAERTALLQRLHAVCARLGVEVERAQL